MSEPLGSTDQVLQLRARLFVDPTVPIARDDERFSSVVTKLQEHPERTAVVVGEGSTLLGVVSDSDVLKALSDPALADQVSTGELRAGQMMTSLAPSADTVARADEPLRDVIDRLNGRNSLGRSFQSLPMVTAEGRVLGHISRMSIQKNVDEILRTK